MTAKLKRKLSEDKLKRSLENRPGMDELKRHGIIHNIIQSETPKVDHVPTKRSRIAIALKGAATLGNLLCYVFIGMDSNILWCCIGSSNVISDSDVGVLKNLILRDSPEVISAVDEFEKGKRYD